MKHFPDDTGPEIAQTLNRPVCSIYGKAYSLKLEKSEAFKRSHKRRVFDGTEGIAFRFKKGNIPWNKGLKIVCSEACKATWFPLGHLPVNTKYNGCVVTRKNSKRRPYKWIRISQANWIMLHVKIWEDANGPVPNGKIIVFKNGDSLNCELENLEMISRSENMMRNTIQRYPEDLRRSMRALGKLKRMINEKDKPE